MGGYCDYIVSKCSLAPDRNQAGQLYLPSVSFTTWSLWSCVWLIPLEKALGCSNATEPFTTFSFSSKTATQTQQIN